jgi:maleylacetoacetate isomerase
MNFTLYFANGANCSDRVRWVLAYKGLVFEGIDVDATAGHPQFKAISPFGRVPVLVTGQATLTESMAIVEFLEELHPEPPLMPRNALERAQVREVCEAVNSSIHPVQNSSVLRTIRPEWNKDETRDFRWRWIATNLEKLRPLLWISSSYAVGDRFTLADIFIAVMHRKGIDLGAQVDEAQPFCKHWAFLMSRPAIAASYPGEKGA